MSYWVMQRLGVLGDETLEEGLKCTADRAIHVHLLRILCERPALTRQLHQLVISELRREDPFVRRAAAEALGRTPIWRTSGPCLLCVKQRPRTTRT